MAKTIAEFFLRRWAEKNIPGVKIQVEGRKAKLTDENGDTMTIMYEPEDREIICLNPYNYGF